MRNIAEIHFSDTTGNGKFSGKPDLPVEIFFLGRETGSAAGVGGVLWLIFCVLPDGGF